MATTFEVRLPYKGVNTYLVEAPDAERAKARALERYQDGDSGEYTGSEWEEVDGDLTVQPQP